MKTVRQGVIEIIAAQALVEPEQVGPATTLKSLGIDSLGLVEIIFVIEETFDIEVPFNANDTIHAEFDVSSVGSVIRAVEGLVAGAEAA